MAALSLKGSWDMTVDVLMCHTTIFFLFLLLKTTVSEAVPVVSVPSAVDDKDTVRVTHNFYR